MFICYFYISVETLIFAKVLEQTRLKNIEFMKTMNYSLIRILFALVIGLVLVLWPNTAASYIVITVLSAFSAISDVRNPKTEFRPVFR